MNKKNLLKKVFLIVMMSIEFLKFGDIEIAKQKFHSSRNPMTTDDTSINKILISDKFA